MNDIELIEKYLRGELQGADQAMVEQRLANEKSFRDLHKTELAIKHAGRYSLAKERITLIAELERRTLDKGAVVQTFTINQILIFTLLVWFSSSILTAIFKIDSSIIKWFGLTLSIIVPLVGAKYLGRRLSLRTYPAFLLSGIVVFVLGSGLDAINQGLGSGRNSEAALIPYTDNSAWWPTKTLVDSLTDVNEENQKLINEVNSIKQTLKSVQDSCLRFNYSNVFPIVRPKSRIVANGSTYEADMFLGVSFPELSPEMKINGKQIPVEIDPTTGLKIGKVKFLVDEKAFDANGRAKTTYDASILIDRSEYLATVEYEVVKPSISVTTGTAPRLYMGCGNDVNIEVPALGASYNPSFSAKGAEITKGSKVGNVIIVPNQRRVEVSVNNAETFIGTEVFDVKPIPHPRIVARDYNGREIDLKNGIKAGSIAGLRVSVEADENFKSEVPKDANFRIRNMSVILARGTQRIQELTFINEVVDLSSWRALMRPGDRLVIEPKSVVRMTFKGGQELVTMTGQDIQNIPIN